MYPFPFETIFAPKKSRKTSQAKGSFSDSVRPDLDPDPPLDLVDSP